MTSDIDRVLANIDREELANLALDLSNIDSPSGKEKEVGKFVEENDTICLIEVMKLFNAVKAGVKGRVTKICAENNQMVEYDQILFLVQPGNPMGKISTQ